MTMKIAKNNIKKILLVIPLSLYVLTACKDDDVLATEASFERHLAF